MVGRCIKHGFSNRVVLTLRAHLPKAGSRSPDPEMAEASFRTTLELTPAET